MILEKETKEKFGYNSHGLSRGSYKLIIVQCDYCGKIQEKKFGVRNNGNKNLNKDACFKCKDIKNKEVVRLKYGVDSTLQLKENQEKRAKTWNDKYGGHPFNNKDVQKKIDLTNIERYGTTNPNSHPDVINKVKETCLKRYGVDNGSKTKEAKEKISKFFTKETHNGKNSKELAEEIGIKYSSFRDRVQKYGFDYAITLDRQESTLETIFKDFLIENNIKYQQQFKVGNYFADFLLLDYNIIVEVDGWFWHSDYKIKDYKYHYNKKKLYDKHGYKSFFFRENEMLYKFDIVKSMIMNAIRKSKKIYARKCTVNKVDLKNAKQFLINNHFMGLGKGDSFGLYYKNDIMSIIQLCRIKNNHYEISRFCSKLNYSITGGFSKLLNFSEKELQFDSLKTFVDLRYGVGDYLSKFGFEIKNESVSFSWTDFNNIYHRMKFKGNTGYDCGLYKIWDCGQRSYVKYL